MCFDLSFWHTQHNYFRSDMLWQISFLFDTRAQTWQRSNQNIVLIFNAIVDNQITRKDLRPKSSTKSAVQMGCQIDKLSNPTLFPININCYKLKKNIYLWGFGAGCWPNTVGLTSTASAKCIFWLRARHSQAVKALIASANWPIDQMKKR